ncbi:MAG: alpha-glucosidase [Acetatifactor sp.]|nr:alpha-glucosidase [Acetatifactor sp.]
MMENTKRAWWKEAVVYQIYPRSFMDSDGDGIGDIRGIIGRLDYLKELGIDVIWLSPVYQSPGADNGYDISDYRAIQKEFGSMEDFDEMLDKAHKMGIKIVMDLVVNHTSDEHPWFLESRKSKDNPYREYYIWREGKAGGPPNNWGASFGGSAWEYDEDTEMYYLHSFHTKQPDINWENEAARDAVYDMMRWWCDKGIDGFRMDVISMISKDQNFPDAQVHGGLYGDLGEFTMNGPRVHEFLKEMNREVLSRYDIMTVGETAGVTLEEAKRYAGETEGELNMVFQFEHVNLGDGKLGKWNDTRVSLREFKAVMSKWQTELSGKAWNSLFLGNHDQPRSVSRFGDDRPEYREVSAKMLALCLHFMQGTPYIYQGEELGMTNPYFDSLEDYRDVECIHAYHELTEAGLVSEEEMLRYIQLRSRDNARTPMQWNDRENGGFTKGKPWIGLNPNYRQINAESERENPDSVFHFYRKLIRLRKENEIMVYGSYRLLNPEDENIYAYERSYQGKCIRVLCNFTDRTLSCEWKTCEKDAVLIQNYENTDKTLLPYEAVAFWA